MSNELIDLKLLKKTLPYKWRVQSINDFTAVCVAYIDSRDVQDLLDEVCGCENWQSDYKEVKGNVYAGVGINISGQWVWKWDCGTESKMDAEKGEASDSFKRAAVKWGVGRFLYSLEIKKLKVIKYKDKNYPLNEETGKAIFDKEELTDYINSLGKQVTKYNHKKAAEGNLPLISNLQFKQLCERIDKGEKDAFDKAKKVFSFESTQLSLLNQKISA